MGSRAASRGGSGPARAPLQWDERTAFRLLGSLAVLVLVQMAGYVALRLAAAASAGEASPADRAMAAALLAAELFVCIHGVGYFTAMYRAGRHRARTTPPLFAPATAAPVAVIVASFNESGEVLEETLASVTAMDYPAFRVYLLDDSTREECRRAGRELAARYGATLVHRAHRAGYKAGAINDLIPRLSEPYLAVLDADQRPRESWLKETVHHLEADPGLALVQAPQVYVGTEDLPVADAARHQQAVFFEYICEGKAAVNAMFCCGSNAVLRREALLAIERPAAGGRRMFFDETSVTEDIATSLHLHAAGWRSAYVNRTYVVGMGPETLAAYFTQQMRWAMGTLALGIRLLPRALRSGEGRLSLVQAWEYFLSGTYYFVGVANAVFMLAPVLYVAAGVSPLRGGEEVYLYALVPYLGLTLHTFYLGMRRRGYPAKALWLAGALSFSTSWTYVKAALVAVLGLKRAFGVTPKGVGGAIPVRRLMPELAMLAACAGAAGTGILVMAWTGATMALAVNVFWSAYHAVLLSTLFVHFNRPVDVGRRPLMFDSAANVPGPAAPAAPLAIFRAGEAGPALQEAGRA